MNFRLLFIITLITNLVWANSCYIFYFNNPIFTELIRSDRISETQLDEAITKDILGRSDYGGRWQVPFQKKWDQYRRDFSFRNQVLFEIKKRQYEKALEMLDVPVEKNLRYRLWEKRFLFSQILSGAINGAVNYGVYMLVGSAGYVAHIPRVRFINPREIPDAVLWDMLNNPDLSVSSRQYFVTKLRLKSNIGFEALQKIINTVLLAAAVHTVTGFVMDPVGQIEKRFNQTTSQVQKLADHNNDEAIQLLETKKARFLAEGNQDKARLAEQMIQDIRQEYQKSNLADTDLQMNF